MSSSDANPRFYLLCDAMFNDWNAAQLLVDEDPTVLEARDGCGETALHYLAIENHLEGVRWLFERGADINTRDNSDCTPLIVAALLGHLEMCRFLLNNGADIFVKDNIGQTALSASCNLEPSDPNHKTLFQMLLARRGDADINLFFDDLDADNLLTHRSPRIAEFWRALGLRSRFDDYSPNAEDEDEED